MLKRIAFYNLSVQQIQPVFYFCAQRMCSSNTEDKLIFSNDNTNIILKMLNSKSCKYLSKFKMPSSQTRALQLHMEKNGPYKSIKDVLEVEGMTANMLNEFLNSFKNNMQYNKKRRNMRSIIIPKVQNISNKEISTVLAIYVGINIVAWTLLDSGENILEWNYESFSHVSDNKNTLEILEMAYRLSNVLPKSDVYVTDDQNFDRNITKSILNMKSYLQRQQLKAMILAFLRNRNLEPETENEESTTNFYLTVHDKVAQLFGLRIGYEITSSSIIANKLLYIAENVENKNKSSIGVYVSKNIMNTYRNQLDYVQDQMNWSLLIAITFLQLGVNKKYDHKFVYKW